MPLLVVFTIVMQSHTGGHFLHLTTLTNPSSLQNEKTQLKFIKHTFDGALGLFMASDHLFLQN